MSLKPKAPVIGYHYKWAMHFAWCRFADTLHRIEAGAKIVWTGCVHENSQIQIDAPDAWGGEKAEGGVVGAMDVLFGGPAQGANDYLAGVFGTPQTGNRNLVSTVFRGGRYGAFVPNPKPMAMLWECIHAMFPGGVAWYPGKAAIPLMGGTSGDVPDGVPPELGYNFGRIVVINTVEIFADDCTLEQALTHGFPYTLTDQAYWFHRANESGLGYIKIHGGSDAHAALELIAAGWQVGETAAMRFYSGEMTVVVLTSTSTPPPAPTGYDWAATAAMGISTSIGIVYMWAYPLTVIAENTSPGDGGACPINAMNPAHMIYDALTGEEMQGEPTGLIDEASFMAAADKLYAEGFGLCTQYDSDTESPWDFIQRICNVIGGAVSQSRITGLYYLDLIRDDYDVESLPVITDDDIIEWQEEATVPAEMVNSVAVNWFDVLNKEERTTAPVVALGHVRTSGEVIPQTSVYKEIPFESIALRCAKRDVDSKSKPLRKFTLTVQRKHRFLRPSMPFRLQAPKRGIADMVCRLGQISHGIAVDGRVRMVALQDIFGLPDTVHISPITPPTEATDPTGSALRVAIEAPYVELAASLSAEQLAAVGEETGYLLTGASAPTRGQRYAIYSALPAETLERRAYADFAPSATTTAAALPLDTTVALATQSLPERIEAGDWAVWDDEIIRIDGLAGGVLTMGRGCADTIPAAHAAGSTILFMGAWNGTDGREYAVGDVLAVKLPNTTGSEEQALADVDPLEVTFAQRQFRPYPPANLMLNGAPIYASGGVIPTPPGGGGGGGGGGGVPTSPPAIGPSGAPASQNLGPNGGYPDDAPFPVPEPTTFGTDVVGAGGNFDAPGDLANWRDANGNPLDARWSLVDGRLCFYGTGTASAFYWPGRRTLAQQQLPHYSFVVDGTVESDAGAKASIGVGLGFSTSGNGSMLASADLNAYGARPMAVPLEYGAPTAISHAFADKRDGYNMTAGGQIVVTIAAPAVMAVVEGAPARVYFDDVAMEIAENGPASTPLSLPNLDFSAGLTDWEQFPPASALSPSPVVTAGVCKFTPVSEYGVHKYLVNINAITDMDAIGKWLQLIYEVNCNDPTVFLGLTRGGVSMSYAIKVGSDYNYTPWATPVDRGDWTERMRWIRQEMDTPGATFHVCVLFKCALGYWAAIRNISGAVTNAPVT